jgi:hypothetical protein
MNASATEVRTAAARALYGRAPDEIVQDLRALAGGLVRELDSWRDESPNAPAIVTLETTLEGGRNLVRQLRIALRQRDVVGLTPPRAKADGSP